MAKSEWSFKTAVELSAALAAKTVSAVELAQDAIGCIERHDTKINAVCVRDFERGLVERGGRAGIGAKAQHAEFVEDLHLDHAIARSPRGIESRVEIRGGAGQVAAAPAQPPSLEQKQPQCRLVVRVEAELGCGLERPGAVDERRLDRAHELRRRGSARGV